MTNEKAGDIAGLFVIRGKGQRGGFLAGGVLPISR